MVSLEDAAGIAMGLPEVTEGTSYGRRTWFVAGKSFAWDRPFSKADIKRFGDEPVPEGPILAVQVEDLAEKEAVLEAGAPTVFTIPHFDGYAAVLIQLDEIDRSALEELVTDGWLAQAPAALARAFLDEQGPD